MNVHNVVRGYHCPPVQQPYWNTIYLDDFPDEELLNMIDHAYETVFKSFSKKVQKEIRELNGEMEIKKATLDEAKIIAELAINTILYASRLKSRGTSNKPSCDIRYAELLKDAIATCQRGYSMMTTNKSKNNVLTKSNALSPKLRLLFIFFSLPQAAALHFFRNRIGYYHQRNIDHRLYQTYRCCIAELWIFTCQTHSINITCKNICRFIGCSVI